MTARPTLLAAAAVVAIVSAYLMGRSSAPTRTVETVTVQRATHVEYRERTDAASSSRTNEITVTGPVVTRWRTAPATTPNCPPVMEVERIEGAREERKEATADQRVTVGKERLLSATEATIATKTTERTAPRWQVSAGPAIRLWGARAVVTGRFSIRAWGPVHIEATALAPISSPRDYTALLGLTLRTP